MSSNVLPNIPIYNFFAASRAEQIGVLLRFWDKVKSRGGSADFS